VKPERIAASLASGVCGRGSRVATPVLIQIGFSLGVIGVLVRIGSANDVKSGQMRVFKVAGTKVNVTSAGGRLYAFDDTCTHLGCSLAKGHLAGTVVTCACHGSQFDVRTGAVLRGPAEEPVRSRTVQVVGDDLLADE